MYVAENSLHTAKHFIAALHAIRRLSRYEPLVPFAVRDWLTKALPQGRGVAATNAVKSIVSKRPFKMGDISPVHTVARNLSAIVWRTSFALKNVIVPLYRRVKNKVLTRIAQNISAGRNVCAFSLFFDVTRLLCAYRENSILRTTETEITRDFL